MKKIIYSLPLLLALGACSSEEGLTPEVPSTPEGNGGYYLTMKFDVPTELAATRTGEILGGEENEWKLTSIDLYLLDNNEGEGKYNVLWKKEGIAVSGGTTVESEDVNQKYNVKAKLSIDSDNDELAALGKLKGHNVTVLVVGNPDQYNGYTKFDLDENVVGKTYSLPLAAVEGAPTEAMLDFGTENGGKEMPMSNHNASAVITAFQGLQGTGEALTAEIRALFEIENGDYIYNLTSGTDNEISVERAVARLDLSPNTKDGDFKGTFKYDLLDGNYGDSGINLELYSVQPFNVNNTSYIVRHGSVTGDAEAAKSALTLWGAGDANAHWIGDPNWGQFTASSPYFTESTRPVYNQLSKTGNIFSIPTGLNTNEPTVVSTTFTSSRHQTEGCYNWCYVTENTLPSITAMASEGLEANATGVLFKFQVLDTEGKAITTKTESTKFPTGVAKTSEGKLVVVLQQTGKKMEIAPEGTDYFLAYPGYITHNPKASSASTLNPMNYGVVRNTVYQLKVNSISTLPDPEDPDYYLTLDINVLNWKSKQVGFDF